LEVLSPNIQLISRNTLFGKYLNIILDQIQSLCFSQLKREEGLVLSCDRSTNVNGNSVTNFALMSAMSSYLISCEYYGSISQTSDFLAGEFSKKIKNFLSRTSLVLSRISVRLPQVVKQFTDFKLDIAQKRKNGDEVLDQLFAVNDPLPVMTSWNDVMGTFPLLYTVAKKELFPVTFFYKLRNRMLDPKSEKLLMVNTNYKQLPPELQQQIS
jgi:hypothetical protein